MKTFKNQKGFSELVAVIFVLSLIASVFIAGVFVWKELETQKRIDKISMENRYIGDIDLEKFIDDCKGVWQFGKCVPLNCKDSDAELASASIYNKGYMAHLDEAGQPLIFWDECAGSGTQVNEGWCGDNGLGGVSSVNCPNGCLDGACIERVGENIKGSLKSSNLLAINSSINHEIYFPDQYELLKNSEAGRRGSFVSFNFSGVDSNPSLKEVQLFSLDSITRCNEKDVCFFGDYPTVDRYLGMRRAFKDGTDYDTYETKQFNDTRYFVKTYKVEGDLGYIRQYTTFFGETEVDILLYLLNISDNKVADDLMDSVKWEVNIQPF